MDMKKFEKILNQRFKKTVREDQLDFMKKCVKEFLLEKMSISDLSTHFDSSAELMWVEVPEQIKDVFLEWVCEMKVDLDKSVGKLIDTRLLWWDFDEILMKVFK